VTQLRIISTGGGQAGSCSLTGTKAEVSLAASPVDPGRLTAAWIQTVHRADGSSDQLDVSATTADGGTSWSTPAAVPGLSDCTGGQTYAAGDPFVSFGADGESYLSSMPGSTPPQLGENPVELNQQEPAASYNNYVYASTSADGGASWKAPVVVEQGGLAQGLVDFPPVTADRSNPGRAYLVWTRAPSAIGFSATSDGGRSWQPGRNVVVAAAEHTLESARVVVTSDSSLLLFYFDTTLADVLKYGLAGTPMPVTYRAIRSSDGGRDWSAPVDVADAQFATGGGASFAADNHGNIYMAWADAAAGRVMLVRSTDDGGSWSAPSTIASEPGVQDATIAAEPDGTLGASWYDERNGGSSTDVWFASSSDDGQTWTQAHLAGPFQLDSNTFVPRSPDPLGDYQGLTAAPGGFAAAFVMQKPLASTGPSDVFFARIQITAASADKHAGRRRKRTRAHMKPHAGHEHTNRQGKAQ
jgi:hypothetical protein